eukprot:gene12531-14492_t
MRLATPTCAPSELPTSEWAVTLHHLEPPFTALAAHNDNVWTCSDEGQCVLIDAIDGAILSQFGFENSVHSVLGMATAERVVVSGSAVSSSSSSGSNEVEVSEVAHCTVQPAMLSCDVLSFEDANFIAATFVSHFNKLVHIGQYNMFLSATIINMKESTAETDNEGNRRALAGSPAPYQSAAKSVVVVGDLMFLTVDAPSPDASFGNTPGTAVSVLQTNAVTGDIYKQVTLAARNGSFSCSDITHTGYYLTLLCALQSNVSSSDSTPVVISVDTELTFKKLPTGLVRTDVDLFEAENVPFTRNTLTVTSNKAHILMSRPLSGSAMAVAASFLVTDLSENDIIELVLVCVGSVVGFFVCLHIARKCLQCSAETVEKDNRRMQYMNAYEAPAEPYYPILRAIVGYVLGIEPPPIVRPVVASNGDSGEVTQRTVSVTRSYGKNGAYANKARADSLDLEANANKDLTTRSTGSDPTFGSKSGGKVVHLEDSDCSSDSASSVGSSNASGDSSTINSISTGNEDYISDCSCVIYSINTDSNNSSDNESVADSVCTNNTCSDTEVLSTNGREGYSSADSEGYSSLYDKGLSVTSGSAYNKITEVYNGSFDEEDESEFEGSESGASGSTYECESGDFVCNSGDFDDNDSVCKGEISGDIDENNSMSDVESNDDVYGGETRDDF